MTEQTLLLIGASRGLGLALAEEFLRRGWRVVATERGESAALHALGAAYEERLEIEKLDIAREVEIEMLGARLGARQFDLLFVNAGVSNGPTEKVGDVSVEEFNRVMTVNALGPMRVIEAFADLVSPEGTLGVMSSGLGSVGNNVSGGWEVYRASKAALNTLMRSYAVRPEARGRAFVIIAPGWVRTDMGGPQATLGIEDSIPGVTSVLIAQAGKPGVRYLDYKGETVAW